MSIPNGNNGAAKAIRSVQEVMDHALMKELIASGIAESKARQEVTESRRMADRYDALMAEGYTDEQIGALWADKTPQEILAETEQQAKSKSAPRTSQKQNRKQTALNKIP